MVEVRRVDELLGLDEYMVDDVELVGVVVDWLLDLPPDWDCFLMLSSRDLEV